MLHPSNNPNISTANNPTYPPFVQNLKLPLKVVILRMLERGSYKKLYLERGESGVDGDGGDGGDRGMKGKEKGNGKGKGNTNEGFKVERRSMGGR
jgi:hypothetical protein